MSDLRLIAVWIVSSHGFVRAAFYTEAAAWAWRNVEVRRLETMPIPIRVEMRAAIAVEGGHLADGQIAVLDGATMMTIGGATPPAGHGGGA